MTDVITLSAKVAEETRAMLARQRVSQNHLARRLGVSAMWVSGRLTGQTEIGLDDLQRIADALGVKVAQLLPSEVRGHNVYSAPPTGRPRDNRPKSGPPARNARPDDRRPIRRHGRRAMDHGLRAMDRTRDAA